MVADMADEDIADTVDADAPAAPASDPFDLDSLLAEFDQATTQQQTQGDQVDQNVRDQAFAENLRAHTENLQLDSKRQELEQAQESLRAQEDAYDEAEALRAIRGDLDVIDEDVQGFIAGRVLKDPAINQVWQNRREDRAAYNRMVARLHGDLQQHEEQRRQKILSREATADAEAIAQAVRGQGGRVLAEPPPNLGRMSNAEFRQHVRDSYGFEPS